MMLAVPVAWVNDDAMEFENAQVRFSFILVRSLRV